MPAWRPGGRKARQAIERPDDGRYRRPPGNTLRLHELGRRDDGQRQAPMPGVSVATMISSSGADVPIRVQIAVALGELESSGLRDRMLAGGRAGTPYRGPGLAHSARPAPEGVIAPKQIGQFTAARSR
jgi:hypothetical protein